MHDGVRSACCNRNANSKRRVFEKVISYLHYLNRRQQGYGRWTVYTGEASAHHTSRPPGRCPCATRQEHAADRL